MLTFFSLLSSAPLSKNLKKKTRPPLEDVHHQAGRRPLRLHQPRRVRVRPLRRGPLVDVRLRALGMAVGRDFKARKNNCIAVIGDGAITGGMAYEAMNHAGFLDTNMIVILNDNQQVSLPTQFNGKNQDPVGRAVAPRWPACRPTGRCGSCASWPSRRHQAAARAAAGGDGQD